MSRRAAVFRLLVLGVGVVLVCALELLLHLVTGLAPAPFLIEVEGADGQIRRDLNPEFPRRFFSGPVGGQFMDRLQMTSHPHLERPQQGALRVVFVGGSTAKGYPHPPHATAAAHLQTALQQAWTQSTVEVYNAGIVAIASFAVARTLEEAMALRPDAVVIYTGHNEFYGVYGAASLRQGGPSIELKHLHYALMQTRTAALARHVLNGLRPPPDLDEPRPASLLEVMAAAGPIAPDDTRRELARQNLQRNLTDMVALCRHAGVPVVLCTLVSNDTDFEPDRDARFVDLAAPDRDRWDDLIARAHSLLSSADAVGVERASRALAHLEEAAALFDNYAFLHFLRGRALDSLGEESAARVAFVRARDLDTTPWRAPPALNETIRRVATAEGVHLVDVEDAFTRASPPAGVGRSLMYDHLHPSRRGQVMLARALARALLERMRAEGAR